MNFVSPPCLLLFLGLSCAGTPAQDAGNAAWADRLAKTGYSMADAIAKGQAAATKGVPYKVELEQDGTRLVYSIDLADGEETINVVLDAKTGAVVENEREDGDRSAVVRAHKVSLAAAVAKAQSERARPVEATLRLVAGKPVVDVALFDGKDASLVTVRVDALTGALATSRQTGEAAEPAGEAAGQDGEDRKWTDWFPLDKSELRSRGRSMFMILEPGYKLYLQGKEGGKTIDLVVSVLDETKTIDGIETRIVEERESEDGKLKEVSRNFFAISSVTSNVYYFGEDVDMYEDGRVVNHEGAWVHGEKKAHFGLFLPGSALLGARFYQEVAPEVAMDRAEIVALDGALETPAGKFEHVMKYEETTPLEDGKEYKWFAPGVGLVRDANLKLVKIEK
ncbi:MAG: PepSY domain-containing protein [Planctomycetota bacterium]